jgi:hypothetical protein
MGQKPTSNGLAAMFAYHLGLMPYDEWQLEIYSRRIAVLGFVALLFGWIMHFQRLLLSP